ncbi:hypothetical protein INR77_04200 [Erythrobacter sp. SCSIO 43205]|uniref:exonuclease domain-containing protein n=1 Tax=Erythrobacter sp. SCSIO 43205 TaxID=2779361 RepID=UPI001CA7DDE8|nr:exonuclease domain-containing protein [Erythrobacter sp. SCSIO 43205]UAB78909.1 hypothetical protein INR77_04200 [Erythrobacter sp. SCSIO 43205]
MIRDYARKSWPTRDTPVYDAPLLALDFELDGLSKDAHLLQAGWVPFAGRAVTLCEARSIDIRSDAVLDDGAVVIHGIGEQRAARGEKISVVLADLIEVLAGRVLVAHAARIEVSAIKRAARAVFDVDLPIRSICTLHLEQRLNPNSPAREAYRLANARGRYGLPDYTAHDALTDAIAAAELFQAQMSRMGEETKLSQVER